MSVRTGEMRWRITIQYQKPPETHDGFGEVTNAWLTLATVWGAVEMTAGSEAVNNERQQATMNVAITIRARRDVKPAMRVVVAGKTLQIVAVLTGNVPTETILSCIEVV